MSVSVALLRPLAAELVRRRIDPWSLLHEIDVDVERLADSLQLVSCRAFESWTTRLIARTGDPAFCLVAGAFASLGSLNTIEPMLLSCGNLRHALAMFTRYAPAFAQSAECLVTEEASRVTLSFALPSESLPIAEYACALIYRLFRAFVPSDTMAVCELHVPYRAPRHALDYRGLFACPVSFGARAHALVLPSALLDHENRDADQTTHAIFVDFLDQVVHQRQNRTSAERVQLAIRHGLVRDRPTVTSVASAIGVTPRALRRRLREHGTNASAVIGQERGRYATRELARNVPIKELSNDLGFSEPSAFHRAFKRWTGLTPTQFRRLASQTPPGIDNGEQPG